MEGAPANDAFATATPLVSALPVTVPGVTQDATLQPGEPTRPGLGRTVWWKWTASATGWVRIQTIGDESTRTILAVHTGAAVESLDLVVSNEYSQSEPSGSEVLFQATAGQLYHIQVGGGGEWEGSFDLSLKPSGAPPLLTALSLTPGMPDVTSEEKVVHIDFSLTDPSDVYIARVLAFRPDGTYHTFGNLEYAARLTGTAAAGTYRTSIYLIRHLPPGAWKLAVVARNQLGVTASYGEGTPMPAGLPTGFTLVNSGSVDSLPPQLVSMALSPATVDVTTATKTVTVTTRLADPLAGIGDFESSIDLWDPEYYLLANEQFSYRNRVAGTNADGTYTVEFTFPAGSPPGQYATALNLADRNQNYAYYGVDLENGWTAFPAGMPHLITVVNSGPIDEQAPSLVSVGIVGSPINVAEHESAEILVRATDNRSGVAEVLMDRARGRLVPLAGGEPITLKMNFRQLSGTDGDATYRAQFGLATSTPPGLYRLVGLTLQDWLGNEATYGLTSLGHIAYPTGVDPLIEVVFQPKPGPYRDWLARYPSLQDEDAGRQADPDGDSFPNLVELALDMDPTKDSSPGGNDPKKTNAPVVTRNGTRLQMEYKLSRDNLGSDFRAISVSPQASSDLTTWGGTSVGILGVDQYRVSLTISPANPQRVMRLMVSDPASTLP